MLRVGPTLAVKGRGNIPTFTFSSGASIMSRDLDALKQVPLKDSIRENYFETAYPPLPVPHIWRVVYQEAMRGQHILWDRDDLVMIEAELGSTDLSVTEADKHFMSRFMVKFLTSSDFSELKHLLKSLPTKRKAFAFILYTRSLNVWKEWLKRNLN